MKDAKEIDALVHAHTHMCVCVCCLLFSQSPGVINALFIKLYASMRTYVCMSVCECTENESAETVNYQ